MLHLPYQVYYNSKLKVRLKQWYYKFEVGFVKYILIPTIMVLLLPPRAFFRSLVNTESLNGTTRKINNSMKRFINIDTQGEIHAQELLIYPCTIQKTFKYSSEELSFVRSYLAVAACPIAICNLLYNNKYTGILYKFLIM